MAGWSREDFVHDTVRPIASSSNQIWKSRFLLQSDWLSCDLVINRMTHKLYPEGVSCCETVVLSRKKRKKKKNDVRLATCWKALPDGEYWRVQVGQQSHKVLQSWNIHYFVDAAFAVYFFLLFWLNARHLIYLFCSLCRIFTSLFCSWKCRESGGEIKNQS